MNERRPLWQRILERHKYPRRLLRPRVPLVLLRSRRWGNNTERRTALQPRVTQYALNLHLQLSWPFVSVKGNTRNDTFNHLSFTGNSFQSNSTRNFLWLTPSAQSNRFRLTSNASLCNLSVLCASVVNNWLGRTTTETQRTQSLHREISLFRESRALILPQTRKLIQLLQQSNTNNSSTHISHNASHESQVTNKSVEVQEVRKIFAGMLLQHSNLATHISSRIFSSFTRVDLQKQINNTPKISTQFHSHRTEHKASQHTSVLPQHVNIESPISLLYATAGTVPVLPKQRGQAPLPDLFLPGRERVNERIGQEGRLASAPLYTQPVARSFVTQPSHDEAGSQSQVRTVTSASPQTSIPTQQQPSLDIGRLTDEVYRHIQRKIRVERERRGL